MSVLSRALAALRPRNHLGGVSYTAPGPIKPGVMDFARTPDPRWQQLLDESFPAHTNVGRLVVAWEAGDRWQPIHRWVVYQVQPWHLMDQFSRDILNGPHPRTGADAVPEEVEGTTDAGDVHRAALRGVTLQVGEPIIRYRVNGPHFRGIDRQRWELHHQLKAQGIVGLPRRFWVVQGPDGGQPFKLSQSEESLWQAEGRMHYAAGDLSYAEFDVRTIRAMESYDLWQFGHGVGAGQSHVTATLKRAQHLETQQRRLALEKSRQMAEYYLPVMQWANRQDGLHRLRNQPVGWKPEPVAYAQKDHEYLTDLNTEIPA